MAHESRQFPGTEQTVGSGDIRLLESLISRVSFHQRGLPGVYVDSETGDLRMLTGGEENIVGPLFQFSRPPSIEEYKAYIASLSGEVLKPSAILDIEERCLRLTS